MMITAFTGYMLLYTFDTVKSKLYFKYANGSLDSNYVCLKSWRKVQRFLYSARRNTIFADPQTPTLVVSRETKLRLVLITRVNFSLYAPRGWHKASLARGHPLVLI
jgi:hypothetical protein